VVFGRKKNGAELFLWIWSCVELSQTRPNAWEPAVTKFMKSKPENKHQVLTGIKPHTRINISDMFNRSARPFFSLKT
jgi:hypothetical protein